MTQYQQIASVEYRCSVPQCQYFGCVDDLVVYYGQVAVGEREGLIQRQDIGDRCQYIELIIAGCDAIKAEENDHRMHIALVHLGVEVEEIQAEHTG